VRGKGETRQPWRKRVTEPAKNAGGKRGRKAGQKNSSERLTVEKTTKRKKTSRKIGWKKIKIRGYSNTPVGGKGKRTQKGRNPTCAPGLLKISGGGGN